MLKILIIVKNSLIKPITTFYYNSIIKMGCGSSGRQQNKPEEKKEKIKKPEYNQPDNSIRVTETDDPKNNGSSGKTANKPIDNKNTEPNKKNEPEKVVKGIFKGKI